jgi:hypothetical protein
MKCVYYVQCYYDDGICVCDDVDCIWMIWWYVDDKHGYVFVKWKMT